MHSITVKRKEDEDGIIHDWPELLRIYRNIQSAILKTSKALGIADAEWKSPYELMPEIAERNRGLHRLLLAFMEAYAGWHDQQFEMSHEHKPVTSDDHDELQKLSTERDKTRTAFLAAFHAIGEQE